MLNEWMFRHWLYEVKAQALKSHYNDANLIDWILFVTQNTKDSTASKQNFFKICLSHLNLWTKILLVLAILVMGALFAFIIRIHQGPIDLAFIKPQIEMALSQKETNVTIGKLGLTWPSLTDPILFDLDNIQVNQEGQDGLTIENAAFSLSGLGLLRGAIIPKYILIERPVIHLVQKEEGLNFLWSTPQNTKPEGEDQKEITVDETRNDVKSFIGRLMGGNETESVFSGLDEIELRQAIIKGEQFQSQQDDYLAVINLKLEKNDLGLQGILNATLPGQEGEAATLKSDVIYRAEQADLTFTADLTGFNPSHFAPFFTENMLLAQQNFLLSGKVQAAFDENFQLQKAMMNLTIPEGEITLPEIYDAPIPLKDIVFDAHLNQSEQSLNINTFEATINNIPINATAKGKIENGVISAPVVLNIPSLPLNNIPPIFPKSHLESSAGEWLTKKLGDGRVYDIVLKTDFTVFKDQETGKRDAKMTNIRVDFKTEGVTVKYSDTLMPVTEAKGEGFYENDTLTIKAQSGKIGDIVGSNMDLKMTDLSVEGGGLAKITLNAKGPLKTALEYVSDEPIAVGDDLGFDVNQVDGIVDFKLDLEFPTVKDLPKEEVKVILEGKVNDLRLPNVVKGLDLRAGPYDLAFKDGAITLKGAGLLGGYPTTLSWLQYLDSTGKDFESRITANITSDQKLRDIFGIGLEDYISGDLPVNVTYIDRGEQATIDVKGDLTPTILHLDPFDYRKESGVAGEINLKGYLTGQDIQRIDQLNLKTKDFTLSNANLSFRKLNDGSIDISRGSFPNTILGKSQLDVSFEITNDNILKIVAKGPVLDIGPFIENKNQEGKAIQEENLVEEERPMMISASATRVFTAGTEEIRNTTIYLETNKTNDITRLEMDSGVGEGSMYLRFKPEEGTGKRTFRMESTDAGYTLRAFGLYDKMRGGKITIYGVPQSGDLTGDLYGSARIDNFRVRSTPVLAKLLGAMSMNGVNDLLNNEGVSFGRLESDFEWQFRDQGNFLVMKDGRTSGSSLGLTFDGSVDQVSNEMNIKGTIVPVSGVNKAIGNIPVIGNILTGGDALIAATYTVSGPASDPAVTVNPLSVLAPGFLRKILFEGSAAQSEASPSE
jgi:hypothetical protein